MLESAFAALLPDTRHATECVVHLLIYLRLCRALRLLQTSAALTSRKVLLGNQKSVLCGIAC